MTRKPLKREDFFLRPKCEDCVAAVFDHPKTKYGLCHLYPMQWATDSDGTSQAVHSPCVRDGWCMQFQRRAEH